MTMKLVIPVPPVPPVRVFKVRRVNAMKEKVVAFSWTDLQTNEEHTQYAEPAFIEEAIEAHKIETPNCGALVFYRCTHAHPNEQGEVFYSYRIEKIIAPGTYFDMVEVTEDFIPHNVS